MHRPGQLDADNLRIAHFPGQPGHHIGGVRPAHADGQRAQPTAVHRVRIGADYQAARKSVLLQHYLMDDARAGTPEPHPVPPAGRFQKLIHFVAFVQRILQVRGRAHPRLYQMVAVHRSRHCHPVAARLHKLQNRHLSGNILVRYPVGAQIDVTVAGAQVGIGDIVQMGKQQLLRQRERTVQTRANLLQFGVHLAVSFPHQFRR